MGRRFGNRFGAVEVVLVFTPLIFFVLYDLRLEETFAGKQLTKHCSCGLLFADPLGDDISRSGKGVLGRFDSLAIIYESLRLNRRIDSRILGKNHFG